MKNLILTFLSAFISVALCLTVANAQKNSTPRPYVKSMYSLPLTLDPIQMNDTASLITGNLIYEGLVKFSPTLKIMPALAERWETSMDGKTITFHIAPSAKFQDSTPVTADDVVNSLKRASSKESRVWKYYESIAENGFRAVDPHTVQLTLNYAYPPILSVLAGATAKILPKSVQTNKDFFKSPIGSGAFQYSKLDEKNDEILLNRFNDFHGEPAKLNQLILRKTTGQEGTDLARTGKIDDLASLPLAADDAIFKFGSKVSSPVAATWIIGLNTRKTPFKDVEVRRAFSSVIDSEAFRKKFFPDAIQAFGYVPPGLPGYKSSVSPGNPSLKTRHSNQSIVIAIPAILENALEIKSFLEAAYKKAGWNVKINLMNWDEMMAGYSNKSLQSFLVSMNMDYPDQEFYLKNFESNNPDNFSGLSDARIDALLKKSRTFQDRIDREKVYSEALDLIEKSAVTIKLFHPKANYWISNCVSGFVANILSEVYIDYSAVSLKPECTESLGRL